jgi:hypothetical protein
MARTTINDSDEGKRVINDNGEVIGLVSGVESGTAYVDPDPGATEKIMSKLGWDDVDENDYPLDRSKIDTITDNEIRQKERL